MRIVGGALRGRVISAPPGQATRPTTDRVREAIFSALSARMGSDLGGAATLDAFAGSGALGLEALSRGACSAVFVERDRSALGTLAANITALDVSERARVVRGDVFALAGSVLRGPFSLILLDPPYTLDPASVAARLNDLATCGAVAQDAVVVWEHGSRTSLLWPTDFTSDGRKNYGTACVEYAYYKGASR